MFCTDADLVSESDVEQKLLFPLLTQPKPIGLGYQAGDVRTKHNLKRLVIEKGNAEKIYFPDYAIVLSGLPVLVVEAKKPGESVDEALREARLYATELNALFPSGVNPCRRVIASDGLRLVSSPVDSATPDISLARQDLTPTNVAYERLLQCCGTQAMRPHVDELMRQIRGPSKWVRPLELVGGRAIRSEELPANTFGATIAGDYGHLFNPTTSVDRVHIARNAYVKSTARERYIEPIDRIIRGGIAPSATAIVPIADSRAPGEITRELGKRARLENQVLLLVGSVGSGKSTFVDYLVETALPREVVAKTLWLRLNLNNAPVLKEHAYDWVLEAIIEQLKASRPGIDFDTAEQLEKTYHAELASLKKGALALLDPSSEAYRTRLVDRLMALQRDKRATAHALSRHLCGDAQKLLVVVLDNCDKRDRDDQLLMFQVAQWVRDQFRCLVVVPLRDTTYDLYRSQPPLDTVLANLRFRIEPPPFIEVLQARIALVLKEMHAAGSRGGTLSYTVPNGMRVTYPVTDQGFYLLSILRSLFAHDRFIRQILSGLAGRDVRRALQMFLDFCMSGHIGEDEIYKIRSFEGDYELPLNVVARVLLRMRRRFYDGDESWVKNLFQCSIDDPLPSHFTRVAILRWLNRRLRQKGPSGTAGFFPMRTILADLVARGHDLARIRNEVHYLAAHRCIVVEHLRDDAIADEDLIAISSSGVVHLQLLVNPDYIAACAEDTYLGDAQLAQRVFNRMVGRGPSRSTISQTVSEFGRYLEHRHKERLIPSSPFVEGDNDDLENLGTEFRSALDAANSETPRRLFLGGIPFSASDAVVREALAAAGITHTDFYMPLNSRDPTKNKGVAIVTVRDGLTAFRLLAHEVVVYIGTVPLRVEEAAERPGRVGAVSRTAPSNPNDPVRLQVEGLDASDSKIQVVRLLTATGVAPTDVFVKYAKQTATAYFTVATRADADTVMNSLNGQMHGASSLRVQVARPRGGRPFGGKR